MKKKSASVGYILSSANNPDLWQCEQCKAKFTTVNIQNLVFKIHEELEKIIDHPFIGVEQVENFIKKYRYIVLLLCSPL